MKLKHYGSDYPKHKRAHSAALRAPMVCPMMGDGGHARLASTPLRYRPAVRFVRPLTQAECRERLIEARYADWLDARGEG